MPEGQVATAIGDYQIIVQWMEYGAQQLLLQCLQGKKVGRKIPDLNSH